MHSRIQYTAKKPSDAECVILEHFLEELADDIITRYEMSLLWQIMKRLDVNLTFLQMKTLIYSGEERMDLNKKRNIVKEDLRKYFEEYDTANVEGLVRFRLPGYLRYLETKAEQMLHQHYVEKEYDDFIFLLRYFVRVQNERMQLLHLVAERDGFYTLYDAQTENITEKCISEFISGEAAECNQDDLLISILITLAPERVVVHGSENIHSAELFQTIGKVFDKTEYCGGCFLCKT